MQPKKPRPLQQAKTRRWAELKKLLVPRKKEMKILMLAAKTLKLKAAAARMKKPKKRRETMIWRWETVSLLKGLVLGSSSPCISNRIRRLWCIRRHWLVHHFDHYGSADIHGVGGIEFMKLCLLGD